jgi:hypothetical protein
MRHFPRSDTFRIKVVIGKGIGLQQAHLIPIKTGASKTRDFENNIPAHIFPFTE